jgi:hypothetical protein
MKPTNNIMRYRNSLKPVSVVSKNPAKSLVDSRHQPAWRGSAFVLVLAFAALVSFVIPAVAAPVELSAFEDSWRGALVIKGGCGLGTKLVGLQVPPPPNGSGTAFEIYHTPECGNNAEDGAAEITSLNANGSGTAQLNFGPTFNFDIQVAPNGQVFNMVDITDAGNYEEGSAIGQAAAPIPASKLAGSWQATLVIDGGCGLGTKLVNFALDSNGVGTATANYHTPACGNNEETGTMEITSLNDRGFNGYGTAQLIFGSTVFNFDIQVAPNGQVFNMVDISDPNNYDKGLAVRQAGSTAISQLAGSWQATLVIDGGCGFGTKLVNFKLDSSGVGTATAKYHTPGCGNNQQTGKIALASLDPDGSGTAELIFGASVFSFNIQVSPNHQVINMVDIADPNNYDEGSAIRQ